MRHCLGLISFPCRIFLCGPTIHSELELAT